MISERIDFLACPPNYRPILRQASQLAKTQLHFGGVHGNAGASSARRRKVERQMATARSLLARGRFPAKTQSEAEPVNMSSSLVGFERQQLVQCRLLEEIRRRRLPGAGGWSHGGAQFGTEPTSLALLALYSSPSGSTVTTKELAPLIVRLQPNGLWSAVGDGAAGVSFWASAMAVNTLMIFGAAPGTLVAS